MLGEAQEGVAQRAVVQQECGGFGEALRGVRTIAALLLASLVCLDLSREGVVEHEKKYVEFDNAE